MDMTSLITPKSIVVFGGSDNINKPGGRVLKNIIENGYKNKLYVINPKQTEVQGIESFKTIDKLPQVDLAIFSIPAKFIIPSVENLIKKGCKSFIVLSAGFSEIGGEGVELENKLVELVKSVDGVLIGPNCMGVIVPSYCATFAGPIPKLDKNGCDFATGSGATAAFILENGITMGLNFSSMFSVGNSALLGVEEIIKYWDENFNPETSSKNKLLYMEKIDKPDMFLKHCRSLINKGCKIAAIKSGSSDAGSRAASSHTGALATSDIAVEALFKKAGVVRCYGREELITAGAIFTTGNFEGKNIAIVTHAGGPGVMLTDSLSKGGFNIPKLEGEKAEELLTKLYPGSSVSNPIDFLATGNSEQLGIILDYLDKYFKNIDAIVVIFGSPGLFDVTDVYKVLDQKMKSCKKPIFPILPSVVIAKKEINYFVELGRSFFPDEVVFGNILTKIYNTDKPFDKNLENDLDKEKIESFIKTLNDGYISPDDVVTLFELAKIDQVKQYVVKDKDQLNKVLSDITYPIVMKTVGILHKSDVGGVVVDIKNSDDANKIFNKLISIKGATSVLIQPMLSGVELFIGAKKEPPFGHTLLAGLGGIFIEVLKDLSSGLIPIREQEAEYMIKKLKSYKIIEGVRGEKGVNQKSFIRNIVQLSKLLEFAPEIAELDLNPLIGDENGVTTVDARVRIKK